MKRLFAIFFSLLFPLLAYGFTPDPRDQDLYDELQRMFDIESKDPFWQDKPYPINFSILYRPLTKNVEQFKKHEMFLFLYWAHIVDEEGWSHTGAEVSKLMEPAFVNNQSLFIDFLKSRSHLTDSICKSLSDSFNITHHPVEKMEKARNDFLKKYRSVFIKNLSSDQSSRYLSNFTKN